MLPEQKELRKQDETARCEEVRVRETYAWAFFLCVKNGQTRAFKAAYISQHPFYFPLLCVEQMKWTHLTARSCSLHTALEAVCKDHLSYSDIHLLGVPLFSTFILMDRTHICSPFCST